MKAVMQKLKQIKDYCSKHEACDNCIYNYRYHQCKVKSAVEILHGRRPIYWDLEDLEDVLDGSS